MKYIDYRARLEFGYEEFREIDDYCKAKGMSWFASCWDIPSVDFIEQFRPPCYKIASASLTDRDLLLHTRSKNRPIILSTGMSTIPQIRAAIKLLHCENLVILHSTSTYPCKPEELNLKMILTLKKEFDCPVGYSGHEVGLPTTVAAAALGACFIERHITLDRAMWGTDQAASVEPAGFAKLVKYIRTVEAALGDGKKQVYESEKGIMKKLRRVDNLTVPEMEDR